MGDRVKLTGRLQSREYQKLLENGEYLTRNAYEVSAFTIDIVDATQAPSDVPPVDARLEFERLAQERVNRQPIPNTQD